MNKKKLLKYLVLGIVATLIATFLLPSKEKQVTHPRDYHEIAGEGAIHVATEYNSISFFVNGDTLSGFHYELIEAFARDHSLKTVITPEMSFEKRLQGLAEGKFDVIAYDVLATSELKDSLLLTQALFIKNQLELAGKTLHVVKDAPSILRIRNLSHEIADTIYIKEIEKYGPEQLIAMVAHGDIDYAVCNESIARMAIDSLPQIDISTDISFTQFYSWAVSKQSPALLDSLNTWLDTFKKTQTYKKLYQKYYLKP